MVYVIFVIYNVTCTNVIYNTITQYKQHSYIDLLHYTVRTANRTQPVSLAVVVAVAWRLSVYRRDWNITHPYIIWFGPRNDIYFYFRLSFIEIESIWRSFFFFINSSLLILIELNMNCRTPPRIGYPLVGACVRAIPTMGTRQALFPKKPEYATRMMYIWTNHVAIAPREFKQILYRNRSRKKCGCITKYNSILPVHVCCVYGAICKCV